MTIQCCLRKVSNKVTKILLYERPITSKLFREVISEVHGRVELVGISSYRNCSEIWSGDYLYQDKYDDNSKDCDSVIDDIICRDRSLSLMERDRAERIVRRFWNGAQALFESSHFGYFYTVSIDCYEIDILLRLADRYGVPAVSWIGTFLGDYARITLRGERCELKRAVSEQEVVSIAKKLLNKLYLPSSEKKNVQRRGGDALQFYIRRKLIEMFYNPMQRILKRDPDNLMFNVNNLKSIRFRDVYRLDYDSYFSPLESLSIDRGKTVYYPMHLIPEASTSYWCRDVITSGHGGNMESYSCFVRRFVAEADSGVHFLIKEHPAMFGKRPLSFYRELQDLPNVDVMHPMVRSNDLLERVDTVLVDDGTVGIEALLRGKRVVSLEKNYYCHLHSNISIEHRVTQEALSKTLSSVKPYAIIEMLLADMFPSDYKNSSDQGSCSVANIAAGVRLYLENRL